MPQAHRHPFTIEASLELITGLRIGAGDMKMHIGSVDNTVIKHPTHRRPIPSASFEGKSRSLLEWRPAVRVREEALGWERLSNRNRQPAR